MTTAGAILLRNGTTAPSASGLDPDDKLMYSRAGTVYVKGDDNVEHAFAAGADISYVDAHDVESVATAVQRANHTGTQLASTISDFAEATDDRVAALVIAGNNIDVTYNDGSGTLTIDVEVLTSVDITDFAEAVDDRVAALLVAGNNIDLTYNDGAGTLTVDVEVLTSADISDWAEAVSDTAGAMVSGNTQTGITVTYQDGDNTIDFVVNPPTVPSNNQTANYTLAIGDQGYAVEMNNASARTITVPPNSSVAFPIGSVVEVWRQGAGSVTLVAGAGVTIRSPGSLLALRSQYSTGSLRKRATDEWVLAGDLA